MNEPMDWTREAPVAITVTDAKGRIIQMNAAALSAFGKAAADLLGSDVLDCHPEHARGEVARLYETRAPNHYTISKRGQRKIIHQLPWFRGKEFAGFVEISIPIPDCCRSDRTVES